MRKMLLLLALFLSIGLQQKTIAQEAETTVSGKILDNNGKGVYGVSVQIKGTHTGDITDAEGNFKVTLPEGKKVLVIKSSNFQTKEIRVSDPAKALVVKLEPLHSDVGVINVYGQTLDPRTNTGDVVTIPASEIEKKPITNIVKALDGATGIQLTSGGGQPGSSPQMLVRGLGSLSANGSPLIVVDGVIYNGSMSSINPEDVASVSLLKDATASSLYGARGANGVVLISMKKGTKSDKPQINISAQSGFVSRALPMMNVIDDPAEYYKMAFLMWRDVNKGSLLGVGSPLSPSAMSRYWSEVIGGRGYNNFSVNGKGAIESSQNLVNPVTGEVNPDAVLMYHEDWLPALDRLGLRQQYNVSTSNGTDNSNYYFSVGYNDDQGILQYSDYKRVTTRLNVDANITSWLKTGLDLNGIYENQNHFVTQSNAYVNPFFTAQVMPPIYPVHLHDDLGKIVMGPDGKPLFDTGINPEYDQSRPFGRNMNVVASLQDDEQTNKIFSVRGITYLEAKFLKDFTARVDYTLSLVNQNSQQYMNMMYGDGEALGGFVNQGAATTTNATFRQRLVWNPSFGIFAGGDNSLALTLSHENTLLNGQNYSLSRSGFTDPQFHQGSAAAVGSGSNSFINQFATESYLAWASYDYKKKYFFSASIRRDGTSRFAPESRWGNFWSVGGGWLISGESFMQRFKGWLSELKVKASYGIQGNEDLGGDYYAWLPNYFFSPNNTVPGYLFNSYGSRDLHWEGSFMFNVGIDYGVLNNRIHGSVNYYRKGNYDLLYQQPFAPSTGIGAIRANIGDMLNSGIELIIKADIVRTPNFTWHSELHLTHNKNQMTRLQGDSLTLYGGGTIMKKGLAVGTFYMPKYAGVDHESGNELWQTVNRTITGETYLDTTSSYIIAGLPEHEQVMGDPWPVMEGAFINTLTYKQISLTFQLNFGIGGKFYDNNYAQLMSPGNAYNGSNWSKDIEDSWTPENKDAKLPSLDFTGDNGSLSDRFMISRTFLKVQNINLSYTLPKRWTDGAGFRSASISVAADNVYLFDGRKGVDVQTSFFGSNSFSYYPYRTVMFGLRLGL